MVFGYLKASRNHLLGGTGGALGFIFVGFCFWPRLQGGASCGRDPLAKGLSPTFSGCGSSEGGCFFFFFFLGGGEGVFDFVCEKRVFFLLNILFAKRKR